MSGFHVRDTFWESLSCRPPDGPLRHDLLVLARSRPSLCRDSEGHFGIPGAFHGPLHLFLQATIPAPHCLQESLRDGFGAIVAGLRGDPGVAPPAVSGSPATLRAVHRLISRFLYGCPSHMSHRCPIPLRGVPSGLMVLAGAVREANESYVRQSLRPATERVHVHIRCCL